MASAHKFLERHGRISKVAWPELFIQDEEETEIGKGSHNSQLCSCLPSFLFLQSVHNFTLPSWATEDTMTKLRELSELSLLSLYGIHKQKEKSRLQGGERIFYIMRKNVSFALGQSGSEFQSCYPPPEWLYMDHSSILKFPVCKADLRRALLTRPGILRRTCG